MKIFLAFRLSNLWKDLPELFHQAVPFRILPRTTKEGRIRFVDSGWPQSHAILLLGAMFLFVPVWILYMVIASHSVRSMSSTEVVILVSGMLVGALCVAMGIVTATTRVSCEFDPDGKFMACKGRWRRRQTWSGTADEMALSYHSIEVNYGTWERPRFWRGSAAAISTGTFLMILCCAKDGAVVDKYVGTLPATLRLRSVEVGPDIRCRGDIRLC
jgi:hypothetical protein